MMKFEDWRKQFSDDVEAAKVAYKEMLRLQNNQSNYVTPKGWKLVPIEPTKEMVDKACLDHGYPCGSRFIYVQGYRSMVDVAPDYKP